MRPNKPNEVLAKRLITQVQGAFDRGDLHMAHRSLCDGWNTRDLIDLLEHPSAAVRKLAVMSLALVGDSSAVGPVARVLHDETPGLNDAADNALMCIWARAGRRQSGMFLKNGSQHLNHGNIEAAIEKFSMAIQADSDFAEAYHQRSIAYAMAERYAEAIKDCNEVLARVPQHFMAMAGLGHCHASMGDFDGARRYYRLALAINPGMTALEESLRDLTELLGPAEAA
ncbi:MAG: tetratricopeptide repeat protein [Phycisphaerae bacterium]